MAGVDAARAAPGVAIARAAPGLAIARAAGSLAIARAAPGLAIARAAACLAIAGLRVLVRRTPGRRRLGATAGQPGSVGPLARGWRPHLPGRRRPFLLSVSPRAGRADHGRGRPGSQKEGCSDDQGRCSAP
jgi:hypothetical protein